MKLGFARLLAWLFLYALLALVPLGLALSIERPAPRGLLIELGAMLGLLGLGVLSMQLVISGRHRWFARGMGQDNLLQFHRQTGLLAWLLVLAHPLTLFVGDPAFLSYLDPRDNLLRAVSLSFVLIATTFLIASSLWRVGMGLQYEWWRAIHATLALVIVANGLVHALLVDHYTADMATKVSLAGAIGIPLALLIETRLLRPWRLSRRPWQVVSVDEIAGDATRLVLEAVEHGGMPFQAGQYAWLTLGDSPFSVQQHPFSMSSDCSQPRRLEFTAKHSGDFTCGLPKVAPGTRAWLEGPYGAFSIDPSAGRRAVFIAGGVGITPIMSMLRRCCTEQWRQQMWLIYANDNQDAMLFRDTLDSLADQLSLTVVHVLASPGDSWTGETGYVDEALLARHLPKDDGEIDYFLCGPPPMMDQVEPILRKRGVALAHLHSERFDII